MSIQNYFQVGWYFIKPERNVREKDKRIRFLFSSINETVNRRKLIYLLIKRRIKDYLFLL